MFGFCIQPQRGEILVENRFFAFAPQRGAILVKKNL